ncbi:MAG: FAD-dependent oxidoreductase [Oscillospiraceae bacterium]|jgi:thioredoxin reductase (NADPH)|nr:FAD-dependent oxidoreductase [Oscillospiraceae bacterium]
MFDIVIVGGGPAGLSAAITARQRGKDVAVVSNDRSHSGLYKAREIGNYPGLPGISGRELSDRLTGHAESAGARLVAGQVNAILRSGDVFQVGYGTEILTSKCVILATGVAQASLFPGEEAFLGRGVSYCATCDGMLFRNKRVCVVCLSPEAGKEADFLESIGCEVFRIGTKDVRICGENQVTSVVADGEEIKCDAVFILRQTIAPNLLIAGLEMKNGHICTDPSGKTNIPGIFAAGDCVGTPYQISKATGEGQVAALSAVS